MKKKLLLFVMMISFHYVFSQSFQRMAIAKGSYKLAARGSSKVTSYCLDFSRKAPTRGMNYGNILSGGNDAIVEMHLPSNKTTRMSLNDAIDKGIIEVKGMNFIETNRLDVLNNIKSNKRQFRDEILVLENLTKVWDDFSSSQKLQFKNNLSLLFNNVPEVIDNGSTSTNGKKILARAIEYYKKLNRKLINIESDVKRWDNLTDYEKTEVEKSLADFLGLNASDLGSDSGLKFINKTDNDVEIKLSTNAQFGSNTEENFVKGVDQLSISKDPNSQEYFQGQVWATNEKNNLLTLKKLGVYDGSTDLHFNNGDLSLDTKKIYLDIRRRYNISFDPKNSDVFDSNFEKWITQRQNNIQSSLNYIGLEGNLDELIKSYQKFKGVRQTGNFSNSLQKMLEEDIAKGIFISKKGKVYTTKKFKIANTTERVFVLEDNVYVKFSNKTSIDNLDEILSSRKYLKEEMEIISLVDDEPTRDALKALFPKNHLDFSMASLQAFKKKLKASKKKSVFVMGHIENQAFVVQETDFKIPLDDLQILSKELDVNIFPLGCNSGHNFTGIENKFNSIDALNRLKPAFENNRNIRGLLKDLSGDDLKVIIHDLPFENKGYLKAQICKEISQAGTAGLVTGGTVGLILHKTFTLDQSQNQHQDPDDDKK
ncbi:MAG: hypothetical protein AAF611_20330 [Bacteroidota bacterium]